MNNNLTEQRNIGEPIIESKDNGSIKVQRVKTAGEYTMGDFSDNFCHIEHSKFCSMKEWINFISETGIKPHRPNMFIYSIWEMTPEDYDYFLKHLSREYNFLESISQELSSQKVNLMPHLHLITDGTRFTGVNTGGMSFVYYLLPEASQLKDILQSHLK